MLCGSQIFVNNRRFWVFKILRNQRTSGSGFLKINSESIYFQLKRIRKTLGSRFFEKSQSAASGSWETTNQELVV